MRPFAISRLLILTAATTAAAQALATPDLVTCERGDRIKQSATLETPRGTATGMVCLDDGDSFSIGTTWVRLDGLDAPAIGRYCNRRRNLDSARCKTGAIALDALGRPHHQWHQVHGDQDRQSEQVARRLHIA